MIIDFHTHVFPDYLAPKAISILLKKGDGRLSACHDGTVDGLLQNMDAWKIDYSVIVPIVTKPSQTLTLNKWAANIESPKIIPFGSFYPHTDDFKSDINYILSLGLKGIKLHTEYQDFHLLDLKMLKAYEYALSKGLILLFHAGEDDGMPPPYKSSPKQFAQLADIFPNEKIVVAHLGGYREWDEVYEHLAGKPLYLDTCMGFNHFTTEQFTKIVEKHGTDKILFASDAPWSKALEEMESLRKTPLSENEKSMILGTNAKKLLNL